MALYGKGAKLIMLVIKMSHITDLQCPTCKARIMMMEQTSQHAHGGWFENARYACGMAIKYEPNIETFTITRFCPKSKEHAELEKHKADIKAVVDECIEKLRKLKASEYIIDRLRYLV